MIQPTSEIQWIRERFKSIPPPLGGPAWLLLWQCKRCKEYLPAQAYPSGLIEHMIEHHKERRLPESNQPAQ